jgi:aspartate/methionine/tyrosine aminotransferase
VKSFLQVLIRTDKKDGVMTPIPQYPLYSATLTLLGGEPIKYYLNEQQNWSLAVNKH